MTQAELVNQLRNVISKVAYMVFSKPQELPYIVYALPDTNVVHADNAHHYTVQKGWLELYTLKPDFELMKQVEDVFIVNGLPWEKENEVYIEGEKLFQMRWSFELI